MWEYMSRRARECAEYILQTGATVRDCANHLGISKSTVHKDVTERLYEVDKELYARVRKVLDKNLSERHIRGGIATRNKYLRRSQGRAECKNAGGSACDGACKNNADGCGGCYNRQYGCAHCGSDAANGECACAK